MDEPISKIDTFSWDVGRITQDCFLVNEGVRPVAEVVVRKEVWEDLLSEPLVANALVNLQYHLIPRGEHHIAVFVFKYPHLLDVIRYLSGESTDPQIFMAWASGKMFGYSEDQIAQYLERDAHCS